MTLIPTNPFLLGVSREECKEFSPLQVKASFQAQLSLRKDYQKRGVLFLPPPSVKDAEEITKESSDKIDKIVKLHNLDPVQSIALENYNVREKIRQVVSSHLKIFAY